jgi:hypothetical protein
MNDETPADGRGLGDVAIVEETTCCVKDSCSSPSPFGQPECASRFVEGDAAGMNDQIPLSHQVFAS